MECGHPHIWIADSAVYRTPPRTAVENATPGFYRLWVYIDLKICTKYCKYIQFRLDISNLYLYRLEKVHTKSSRNKWEWVYMKFVRQNLLPARCKHIDDNWQVHITDFSKSIKLKNKAVQRKMRQNEVKVKVLLLYSAARPDGFSSALQPYPWQETHPDLVWAITFRWSGRWELTSHVGLSPSVCPPYVFASPNFTPWYSEAHMEFTSWARMLHSQTTGSTAIQTTTCIQSPTRYPFGHHVSMV